jgi:hypothetical protein
MCDKAIVMVAITIAAQIEKLLNRRKMGGRDPGLGQRATRPGMAEAIVLRAWRDHRLIRRMKGFRVTVRTRYVCTQR